MPTGRLSMRRIPDVLRSKYAQGRRNRRFFSLTALNAAIRRLLDELNVRVMRGYRASRADLFATIDRPSLQPLPPEPYTFARWKRARVAPDYHVEIDSSC